MPCGTRKRSKWCGSKNSVSYGMHGRGPTSDISPRRTLSSCGSSSRLVFRRKRPNVVTSASRESLYVPFALRVASALIVAWMYSRCSASSVSIPIVRNLNTVNGRWFVPSRVWRKKTGPGDSRLIRIAATRNSGEERTRRIDAPTTSMTRFVIERQPGELRRRHGQQREPLDQVDVRPRPDELVEPWNDVDDHVLVAEGTNETHRPFVGFTREGDDHPFDVAGSRRGRRDRRGRRASAGRRSRGAARAGSRRRSRRD